LFLPLGLERGGGDDEHAPRLPEVVEQGAGGDGLDGFSEAHFIGEQGASVEGEVEHALALIGIERAEGDVLRVASRDDAGFVFAAQEAAFLGVAAGC
jgi:hypothetical protein